MLVRNSLSSLVSQELHATTWYIILCKWIVENALNPQKNISLYNIKTRNIQMRLIKPNITRIQRNNESFAIFVFKEYNK